MLVFKENKIDYVKNKLARLVYNWNQALNVDSTKIITANYLQDFYLTILRENLGSQCWDIDVKLINKLFLKKFLKW